ncbi:DUF481 domain-containing protein [Pinibacter soli]|uniref:DUF481 domain-containing protein n=1 Tax=Pinibacter soli TaxID=3044211 RepID=A0ABT6R6Z6_9BACT|nr:DUF481 domain-containing protein [Pinibacter soli]MDI3318325.1 DUF481 domain-containing protein [Pinibacter soli]
MKRLAFVIFVFIVACNNLHAQRDTVYFLNGSMVVGEVKKIKLGVMTFDPDDANDITIQLRKIRTLSARTRVFRIESIKGEVYYGKILSDSEATKIFINRGYDTTELQLENISVLYPYESTVLQRFSGNVSVGYSFTRSSDLGRFNFDTRLSYTAKKNELTFSASGIYTITDSSFSRDREDIYMKDNYYFSPTWFASVFLAYQRNLELGLSRRYQEGLGAGNKFLTRKSVYAWGRLGMVFNQEKSTEDVRTGTQAELFGQLEFNFFRFSKPEINLLTSQTFYYSLTQKDRFRYDGSTDLSWEIFDDFKLTLSFYNNFDSKPPVAGSRTLDFGVVFGIAYSFNN